MIRILIAEDEAPIANLVKLSLKKAGYLCECVSDGEEAAEKINHAKDRGGRVICVGTTSCRTIESAADENGRLKACSGWTEIFIYPGYSFKIMDELITNFHLPEYFEKAVILKRK